MILTQKVIDEIKHCVEQYGIKEISFWDEFIMNLDVFREAQNQSFDQKNS